jgi:hypothetical protein
MKKQIAKLSMLTLCAAAILVVPALSRAQATTNAPAVVVPTPPPAAAVSTPPAAAQTPPVKKHTAASPATLPFRGSVTAVDTNAMTLTVGKRTFNMTSETTVTRDDKPAVLANGVAGEPVRGSYKKNADGKLDAVTIRFGGKQKEPAGN